MTGITPLPLGEFAKHFAKPRRICKTTISKSIAYAGGSSNGRVSGFDPKPLMFLRRFCKLPKFQPQ